MTGEKQMFLQILLMLVAFSRGVAPNDQRAIVDEHNRLRGSVAPPAANMLKMSWDDELSFVAQGWAEACRTEHDSKVSRRIPERYNVGQNMAWGYDNWPAAIQGWYSEYKNFVYDDDGMDSSAHMAKIEHYTQVVWARTTLVGCGYTECSERSAFVCNYAPAGNIGSLKRPYEKGNRSCQGCPNNCVSKLCDCGWANCQNDGTLDINTCECNCSKAIYQGKHCDLICKDQKEPPHCRLPSFEQENCQKYLNTRIQCPVTCGICPSSTTSNTTDIQEIEGGNETKVGDKNSVAPALTASILLASGLLLALAAIFVS